MPSYQEKPIAQAKVSISGGAIQGSSTVTSGCLVKRNSLGDYTIELSVPAGTNEVGVHVTPLGLGTSGVPNNWIWWKVVGLPSQSDPSPFTQCRILFGNPADGTLADPAGFMVRVDRVAIGSST